MGLDAGQRFTLIMFALGVTVGLLGWLIRSLWAAQTAATRANTTALDGLTTAVQRLDGRISHLEGRIERRRLG